MGGLICGSMETIWGQHEDNVETTWGPRGCGNHMGTMEMWTPHGDNVGTMGMWKPHGDNMGTMGMWTPHGDNVGTVRASSCHDLINMHEHP